MSSTVNAKRPVNMTLDAEIVRRARQLTGNLSETVEAMLRSYVEAEECKRADVRAQIAQWVEASNAVVAEHGSPSDEYSPL